MHVSACAKVLYLRMHAHTTDQFGFCRLLKKIDFFDI